MTFFRDKQCFNTQFAHMSSVFCLDRQPSLMPLSLNNNCPSKAPFQIPIQFNSTSIEQSVSIQENLLSLSLLKMVVISNTLTASTSPHDMISGGNITNVLSISVSSKLKLPSWNYFKVLKTLTTFLSGHL